MAGVLPSQGWQRWRRPAAKLHRLDASMLCASSRRGLPTPSGQRAEDRKNATSADQAKGLPARRFAPGGSEVGFVGVGHRLLAGIEQSKGERARALGGGRVRELP